METTVNERVNAVIRKKNLNSASLSRLVEISPQNAWNYLSGKTKMPFDFVEKILLAFPDVSAEWLVRGTGSMYLSQQAQQVGAVVESESVGMLRELVGSQRETISLQREKIAALEEENASLKKQHSSSCQKIASGVFSSVV